MASPSRDGDPRASATVGFVGLGTMGGRMARSMVRGGLKLVVYDASPAVMEAFAAEGIATAASPAQVAGQVDVLHLSLPDSPEVVEVACGAGGIVEGARPGLVVVDHSSVAASTPQMLSDRLRRHGVQWLDAPVSGGPAGAAAGTLTVMVGGEADGVERCRHSLAAIAAIVEYMGPSGTGATTKIVNQLAVGIQTMAVFEAFALGVTSGIPAQRLFEVMRTSSAGSWVMEKLVPAVLLTNRQREVPAAWFALRLQGKDMRVAVETASALGVPLAAGALSHQLYSIAEGLGWGSRDQVGAVDLYADAVGIDEW